MVLGLCYLAFLDEMADQRSKTNRWNWEVSGFEPRKSSSNASFVEGGHRTTGPLLRRNSISTPLLPPKQALASKVNGLKEKVKVKCHFFFHSTVYLDWVLSWLDFLKKRCFYFS